MTRSLDISSKIPEGIARLLRDVKTVADPLSIRFIVVGAMARDFILAYGHEMSTGRRTEDVDLCIEVAHWDDFQSLRQNLIQSKAFGPVSGVPQRLLHSSGLPLDIVPFGAIESEARFIAWPPGGTIRMNAIGLREASQHTVDIQISAEPPIHVMVMSLPSQVTLKLISWKDRHDETDKDGEDLAILLQTYADIPENQDRLYGECQNLLEAEGFDLTLGGCRLLGQDVSNAMGPEMVAVLREIIRESLNEEGAVPLIEQMAKRCRPMGDREARAVWSTKMLRSFFEGIRRGCD